MIHASNDHEKAQQNNKADKLLFSQVIYNTQSHKVPKSEMMP